MAGKNFQVGDIVVSLSSGRWGRVERADHSILWVETQGVDETRINPEAPNAGRGFSLIPSRTFSNYRQWFEYLDDPGRLTLEWWISEGEEGRAS